MKNNISQLRKKNQEIDDRIKYDQLKKAEQNKLTLEQKLSEVTLQIDEIKQSLISERLIEPKPQHQLKKMIEISDDRNASEQAEFLIRKLNYDKKLREKKKLLEIEKREQSVKISLDDIKQIRVDKQDKVKYEKHHNIFERLDQHEKNKLNLVSSESNNIAFIKGLYKGAHYNKPLKDLNKNKIILPHLPRPQDLYSYKMTPKKIVESPKKPVIIVKKFKGLSKEFLADRIEREERILQEREKILQEEKKILETRKKQFETRTESKKIKKELEDIEKALFNYQSLKKYDLSPVIMNSKNKSQDNIVEQKFLEYKNELRSWDFEHLVKSEFVKKKMDNTKKNIIRVSQVNNSG